MRTLYVILVLLAFMSDSYSQAFCSLRNPNSQIKKFYPECNSYKTIVGTIDTKVTNHVSKITGLKLHKNEIGRHNLYVVKKGESDLGLVHSRSDLSRWGLIETVWALNDNLTIADYDFQRFRSSHKSELLSSNFKSQLIGKNFYELKNLYRESLNKDQTVDINNLFSAVIASALKAIAVTEYIWSEDLTYLRNKKMSLTKDSDLKKFDWHTSSISTLTLPIENKDLRHFIFSNQKILYHPISNLDYLTYKNIVSKILGESP